VAEYCWLAVRTDQDAPRHRGISLLVVEMDETGITVKPMWTMGDSRTNEVFMDDVKIPKSGLVGEENQGVKYIMGQLEFERMFPYGHHQRLFNELVDTVKNDDRIVCDAATRREIAQRRVELEVCSKLYFRIPELLSKQRMPRYESAMEKLFVTEYAQRLADTAMNVFGPFSQLTEESPLAPAEGKAELAYRASLAETIYGGTSEIMRTLIAQKGLELPRAGSSK
jgi:alkylation response protein AidB-like acyl-CoA dehydrogenase